MNNHEEFDVVVIGGGPGGATTAGLLAQRGRRVLVLEQQRFPRFHIGESLLPASAPVLASLGLADEMDKRFVRKYSARFLDDAAGLDGPEATARYLFAEAFAPSTPFSWQVPRAEFDALLLRRAAELGAEVREGVRVERAIREDGAVTGVEVRDAAGEARRIGARVVVDASGRDALLTSAGGRQRIAGLDKTAIFTHIDGGLREPGIDAGQIEIIILAGESSAGGPPGWAWFIPFRDGRSSVGFVLASDVIRGRVRDARALFGAHGGEPSAEVRPEPREYADRSAETSARLERVFEEEVARSPWMSRLLDGAPRVGPVRAAADYSFRVGELAGAGWLAVGDAAGFLDPLFSTGAHLAIGGAVRATKVIDEALAAGDTGAERFAVYARGLRAAGDLFLGAVQSFYRGELYGMLFAKDQRATLRRIITTMLAGDVFHEEGAAASWVSYFRERFPPRLGPDPVPVATPGAS